MTREFLTYFTFDNHKCLCEIERIADNKTDSLTKRLAIKCLKDITIPMAYYYGEGLKISNVRKSKKNNILGEFLGIKKDDLYAYKSFFEKYGFLFDLKNESYYTFSIEEINSLKNNLMAFVLLLKNQFSEHEFKNKVNIQELLDSSLYLIFKKAITIKFSDEIIFVSNESKTKHYINSIHYHKDDKYNVKYKKIDGQTIEYFSIYDSLSDNEINEITLDDYSDLTSEKNPQWFINLCRAYKNKNTIINEQKYYIVVDFLFNFVKNYSMFLPSDISLTQTFDDDLYRDLKTDKKMLNALINVSKVLLEDEFNFNLYNVVPTFNVVDMLPDWKLPSLYSSLYFSLFYLNNKEVGLRKCGNINCNQFFQVTKSNSKKKYCSIECCNAVGQRNYQNRKRQKKK